ncbi:hypothetical protein [Calothrix sp. PCC 6303]|uniref:hypothetical protein n=1 Tax=Calothrix sp. PCC 6303 TaxID=1170562 RepID=UPI0002A020F7|nr:hypothetical protein [Calothrix sp. PCC 6303]AFY99805.1 hypothetical protein Cal6303_0736 [Calothrix sp. PCC 6303]
MPPHTNQPTKHTVQVDSRNQQPGVYSVNNIAGYFIISIPIILFFSILGYKKYRKTVYRHRVEKLEKLWHIDIDEKSR